MISILIPIYNQNCSTLIEELRRQAELLSISYEIVAMDDASFCYKEENRTALSFPYCKFIELPENIGRSAIRNRLAEMATHHYFLFMDCDTFPADSFFLQRYLFQIEDKKIPFVVCGGYKYSEQPPIARETLFRWKYGKNREEISAENREKSPYRYFSSFNFLIDREAFEAIHFDETIKEYGYEDTWFGIQLDQHKIPVYHIDNQMFQVFIDDSDLYLQKVRKAVRNLYGLYRNSTCKESLKDIRLVKAFQKTEKYGLCGIFAWVFKSFQKFFERNFGSSNPSLFLFDIYRLSYLCVLKEEDK